MTSPSHSEPQTPAPEELKVGDLVTGIFRGEKPITYVDNLSVMVQITPSYEQAYFRKHVRKVPPKPGGEKCDPCAVPGMTFDEARELGRSVAMCTSHWNRWVARWVNSDDEPGVSAHLIWEQAAGVVHACPPFASDTMPCCGKSPFEVPQDRMTLDLTDVTCSPSTTDPEADRG